MHDTTVSPKQLRRSALPAAWWLSPILGVLSVIAGIVVLAKPGDSLATLAVVSGIFLLVDGVFELATSFDPDTQSRGTSAVLGVLGLIAGVLLIRHPVPGVTMVALLLGTWLVALGAVRLAWTVVYERRPRGAVLGLVQLVAGIVIVATPGIGFATLALLVGVSFLANGAALIAIGWMIRTTAS
jgi:uncharacterized membrane protein HdeD (DUF308 family)